MRLLKLEASGELSLTEFVGDNVPEYAILSHTWGADNSEVTFKDLTEHTGTDKVGYAKLRFCGNQATNDGLQYFRVDTCCFDKSSSAELTEAINSMFQWYHEAAKCYVYLTDVSKSDHDAHDDDYLPHATWKSDFRSSRWFTRGWTLQELIAPASVEFFSVEGIRLGDKRSMEEQIHEITNIATQALRGDSLSNFSIDERLSWAKKRITTRKEDGAYSLLGIFDIHMPLIYGEGLKAFDRLREEINKSSNGTTRGRSNNSVTKLQSDSVFLQQRLLVREDVESFLSQAFCQDGVVRAVLHGLPGVGKSITERHFAYKNRKDMAVLWIPASSESEMVKSFEKYAKQISAEDGEYSEPVSTLGEVLPERFSANGW